MKFHPGHDKQQFSTIFSELLRICYDFEAIYLLLTRFHTDCKCGTEMEPVRVDRPVTGRPVLVLTLEFFFFHVKIYKTSVGFQEYLSDNI